MTSVFTTGMLMAAQGKGHYQIDYKSNGSKYQQLYALYKLGSIDAEVGLQEDPCRDLPQGDAIGQGSYHLHAVEAVAAPVPAGREDKHSSQVAEAHVKEVQENVGIIGEEGARLLFMKLQATSVMKIRTLRLRLLESAFR